MKTDIEERIEKVAKELAERYCKHDDTDIEREGYQASKMGFKAGAKFGIDLINSEYIPFKEGIIEYLSKQNEKDKIFMYVGEKGYSLSDIKMEIETSTEVGIKFMKDMFVLTLDLMSRGNKELMSKYDILQENKRLKNQ